jgi:hypothetical protein
MSLTFNEICIWLVGSPWAGAGVGNMTRTPRVYPIAARSSGQSPPRTPLIGHFGEWPASTVIRRVHSRKKGTCFLGPMRGVEPGPATRFVAFWASDSFSAGADTATGLSEFGRGGHPTDYGFLVRNGQFDSCVRSTCVKAELFL